MVDGERCTYTLQMQPNWTSVLQAANEANLSKRKNEHMGTESVIVVGS